MNFIASIMFDDVFDEERREPEFYLRDVPSLIASSVLSIVNSQLYNKGLSGHSQWTAFQGLIAMLDEEQRSNILQRLSLSETWKTYDIRKNEVGFFSRDAILDLMIISLRMGVNNHVVDSGQRKSIIIQKILKAYFSLRSQINESIKSQLKKEHLDTHNLEDLKYFMWPSLLKQSEYFDNETFSSQAVKGFYFLDYLKNSKLNSYLQEFLSNHGHSSHITYLMDFVRMIMYLNDTASRNEMFKSNIRINDPIGLLTNYVISEENLFEFKYAEVKELKSRPLIKTSDNQYFIVNHDFLISKLYNGLVFDVYHNTKFSDEYSFEEFRNEMGQFTDKRYFHQIFEQLIKPDYPISWVEPGDKTHLGFPDYYLRNGNHAFLIEIKDIIFNENLMQSTNLEEIQRTILDRIAKFGKKAKGAGQLLKTIIKLDNTGFEFDKIQENRYKNLRVYPIIVHSNHYLKLPGINLLVHKLFQEALLAEELRRMNAKYIFSPVLIHIDFFIDEFPILRFTKNKKLLSIIQAYQKATRHYKNVSFIPKTAQKSMSKVYSSFEYFEEIKEGEPKPLSVLEKLGIKEIIEAG